MWATTWCWVWETAVEEGLERSVRTSCVKMDSCTQWRGIPWGRNQINKVKERKVISNEADISLSFYVWTMAVEDVNFRAIWVKDIQEPSVLSCNSYVNVKSKKKVFNNCVCVWERERWGDRGRETERKGGREKGREGGGERKESLCGGKGGNKRIIAVLLLRLRQLMQKEQGFVQSHTTIEK